MPTLRCLALFVLACPRSLRRRSCRRRLRRRSPPRGFPLGSVAVVVQEVGAARATLSVNAAPPMNPASMMKLVTTYAALELLGPAYRWKTEA